MDKRERLAVIFRDTQQFYSTNPALMAAVEASRKNTLPLWQGHYEKNLKGSKTLWLLLLQKQRSAWPTR